MPVFDFNNTPDKKQECVCTYTVLHSNEKAATPERPMLVLDNSRREWKHHSCGVFANQARQTAFEFKEKDGTYPAGTCRLTPVSSAFLSGWGRTT